MVPVRVSLALAGIRIRPRCRKGGTPVPFEAEGAPGTAPGSRPSACRGEPQVIGQRLGRLVPTPRVLLQALQADRVQVARDPRVEPRRRLGRTVADGVERLDDAVAAERRQRGQGPWARRRGVRRRGAGNGRRRASTKSPCRGVKTGRQMRRIGHRRPGRCRRSIPERRRDPEEGVGLSRCERARPGPESRGEIDRALGAFQEADVPTATSSTTRVGVSSLATVPDAGRNAISELCRGSRNDACRDTGGRSGNGHNTPEARRLDASNGIAILLPIRYQAAGKEGMKNAPSA